MSASSETRPLIIALVWLAGLGAAAQFGKIALTLDAFRASYAVGEVWLGYLISSVGTVGLIFGVVGGALLGRVGIRRAFIFGLFGAAVLSALQAIGPSFAVMIGLRIVEGATHLALVVAGPILMARHSSDAARPAVMTLWSSFFGVGFMILAVIAPPMLAIFGLSGFLLGHAVFMDVLGALALATIPKGTQGSDGPVFAFGPAALYALHRRIYTSPWLSAAALGFVCYTVLYISLLAYLPDYVAEASRAGLSTAMPLVSILTSLTLGIWLLSRMDAVRAVQLGFIVTGLSALLLLASFGTSAFYWAALFVLAGTGFIPGASFAVLTALNPADSDRALATGAIAQMGNVGTTTGPPLLAAIISVTGFGGIVGFVVFFCMLGIAVHAVQKRRRGN